eukprot:7392499-Alexandrium_andersonii.AAC.1
MIQIRAAPLPLRPGFIIAPAQRRVCACNALPATGKVERARRSLGLYLDPGHAGLGAPCLTLTALVSGRSHARDQR